MKFIAEGQKAGYFPTQIVRMDHISPPRLEKIDLDFRTLIHWDKEATCPPHEDEVILALSDEGHSVVCDSGDTLVIMGPGNDWLEDITGNDIILPGPGDDIVDSGTGSDIFIFNPHWGHDSITLESRVIEGKEVAGYPYRYTSFLIFGPGLSPSDFTWEGNTLHHTPTGDTISLNTRDVNLLFADHPSPVPEAPAPQYSAPAQVIDLEKFWAESVTVRGHLGYYARGVDGLAVVDLRDPFRPLLLSEIRVPGRAMSVHLSGHTAFIAQGDTYLEGKKGWVSIVDISTPRQPKHLTDISYGNSIYNVATAGKRLYVSDSHFFDKYGELHTYDISNPAAPTLLSSTDIPHYAKYIACLDRRVYLSDFRRGVTVVDVSDDASPRIVNRYRKFKKTVWAIKTAGDRLIVNQGDNRFSVVEPHRSKGIRNLCDVTTTDREDVAGLAGYGALVVKGDYIFRAEGPEGVTIHRITRKGRCRLVRRIPSGNRFITSLYITGNILISFDGKKHIAMHSLSDLFPDSEPRLTGEPNRETDTPAPRSLNGEQLQTLLHRAVTANDPEQIADLCRAGADPNRAGHERHTPVEMSAHMGHLEALETLLRHGGDPNRNHGSSMTLAAVTEHFEAMKLLAAHGGHIGQRDEDGCTTLHYVAQYGTVDMVRYLIDRGVPTDATCRGDEKAVDWARYGNNTPIIAYLSSMTPGPPNGQEAQGSPQVF
ncbi:ankyrin repeat domain-containing protein [Desulfoluna limicola]|nr:ankyrin repeat domain-containing protein [Desulfoluna limicola]